MQVYGMCFVERMAETYRFNSRSNAQGIYRWGTELFAACLWPLQVQVRVHNVCQDQTVSEDYVKF